MTLEDDENDKDEGKTSEKKVVLLEGPGSPKITKNIKNAEDAHVSGAKLGPESALALKLAPRDDRIESWSHSGPVRGILTAIAVSFWIFEKQAALWGIRQLETGQREEGSYHGGGLREKERWSVRGRQQGRVRNPPQVEGQSQRKSKSINGPVQARATRVTNIF
jgi:hypothetical protein